MPYQLIRREHKAGQLVPVPLDGLTWHRSVGLTHRRRGSLSPAAIALLREIKKAISEIDGPRPRECFFAPPGTDRPSVEPPACRSGGSRAAASRQGRKNGVEGKRVSVR